MPATTPSGPACPPHHWRLSAAVIEGVQYDHHRCVRCGAEKDVPLGDSPSMFWDRAAEPESVAWTRWRLRTGHQVPHSASQSSPEPIEPAPSAA